MQNAKAVARNTELIVYRKDDSAAAAAVAPIAAASVGAKAGAKAAAKRGTGREWRVRWAAPRQEAEERRVHSLGPASIVGI